MNFLNSFHNRFLFFFVAIAFSYYQALSYPNKVSSPEPIVTQITSLPSSYISSFREIVSTSNQKLIVTGDNCLWLFDGNNWESLPLENRPRITADINGKVYYSINNRIESLTPLNNGLLYQETVLDTSFTNRIGNITDLVVGPKNQLFFSTKNEIWCLADKPIKIDNTESSIALFGNSSKIFYSIYQKGIYLINPENLSTTQIPNTQGLSNNNLIQVFESNNNIIAITHNYPWINLIGEKNDGRFKEIQNLLLATKSRIKKAFIRDGEIYLFTAANGIFSIFSNGNIVSHINFETHASIDLAVDLLPYSSNQILVLTPSSILNITKTNSAGVFGAKNGIIGVPNFILYSSGYIYCATRDVLLGSEYKMNSPGQMNFVPIKSIHGPVSTLYEYNSNVYLAGNSGVYTIDGLVAKPIFSNTHIKNADYFAFIQIEGSLWIVTANQTDIIASCVSKPSIKPIFFSLPEQGQVIERISTHQGSLFALIETGKWYVKNVDEPSAKWEAVCRQETFKGSLFIPNSSKPIPYFTLEGNVFRYDYKNRMPRKHLLFEENGHVTPFLENDSLVIVKRFRNTFPNIFTLWLYNHNKNLEFVPSHSLTTLPSSEILKQVLFLPDSTLIISSTSGLIYFKNRNEINDKPEVYIHKANLTSTKGITKLRDSYFTKQHDETLSLKSFNRNLTVSFSSNGTSLWTLGMGNVLYSCFIEGYDSEWTSWSSNKTREIYGLKPGSYTLNVKTKNYLDHESEIESLSFSIKPRFFETPIFFLAFVLLGFLGLFMLYKWRRYFHAKVRYKLESLINIRTEELVKEKEKTDNLLARVLPRDAASELKEKGRVNTQRFQVVTVLFSDIEGFTRITDETNPEVLIDQLDRFFLNFDSVVEKYRIEKIKTIGDAYMCAGGIPEKNRTNPVEVVLAALEMMQYMKDLTTKIKQKQNVWDLRIGIDTGPVIAGVVGRNKLSYDIWGSTVNTASRMESSGESGQINISGNTFMLVKDYFVCTYRGKMPIKNKGDIQMYFVNGIKPSLSQDLKGIVPNYDFKIQLQLIRLGDLEDFILEKLEKGLPKTLYYHNLKHTVDVYTQVELIGRSENVSKEEMLLLRTAALFHDAGHLIDYDTHEEMAVKLAREILPEYQYTEKQIEVIAELIMSTKLPPNPKNLLEEIMCDADLDYLGRPDFIPVSNTLYKELHEHGKVGTLREWNQMQIKFIDKHSYFTKTARRLRNVNKQSQLDKLKAWMEKN